jgi:dTDP-4-dehydrorhamnose reductase
MDIATATNEILKEILRHNAGPGFATSLGGTYHMTAAGQTSWYDFARAILEQARGISSDVEWFAAATRGRPMIARHIVPVTTEEFPSPARRPNYSVLSNDLLLQTFGIALPDWAAQLRQCLASARLDETQAARSSARSSL